MIHLRVSVDTESYYLLTVMSQFIGLGKKTAKAKGTLSSIFSIYLSLTIKNQSRISIIISNLRLKTKTYFNNVSHLFIVI